jgi:cell division protein FtsB
MTIFSVAYHYSQVRSTDTLTGAPTTLTFDHLSDNRKQVRKKGQSGRMKRYLFLAGIIAVGAFAVFGDKGIVRVYGLWEERNGIERYNAALEAENRVIEEDIRLLKTDKRYIAHIAKKELGMIGRDEVVFRIEAAK